VQGDGFSGSNGNVNCKGFTCSLDPTATESTNYMVGLLLAGGILAELAFMKKKRS